MTESAGAARRTYPELALIAAILAVAAGLLLVMVFISALQRVDRAGPDGRLMLTLGLAQVMADCSLVGIWWARSSWPSHAKTLLAIGGCAALWSLLVMLLNTAEFRTAAGTAWAASFATQAVVSGLLATLIQSVLPSRAARRNRFSILFLFIWTSLVAVMLGAGRRFAERLNLSAADILGWEFFLHLQVIGILNALLAAALLAVLGAPGPWVLRSVASVIIAAAMSLLTPAIMHWIFANPGASFLNILLLLGAESAFLLFALVPMQLAGHWSP